MRTIVMCMDINRQLPSVQTFLRAHAGVHQGKDGIAALPLVRNAKREGIENTTLIQVVVTAPELPITLCDEDVLGPVLSLRFEWSGPLIDTFVACYGQCFQISLGEVTLYYATWPLNLNLNQLQIAKG